MRFDEEVVLSIFIGFVLLPKISKQEKPEDCIPFKQYWSTLIFDKKRGTCAPCPRFYDTCSDQGADKDACEASCFAKPTIPPLKPPTIPPTPTSSYIPPGHSSVLPNAFTPIPTIYPSAVHSYEPRESQKSIHVEFNLRVWLIALVVVLAILAVVVSPVALVVLLLIRKSEKRDENNRDGENGMVLEPLQQNNRDDRGHEQNDGDEERGHVPYDDEERAHGPNADEERAPDPNDEQGQQENNVEASLHPLRNGEVRSQPYGPSVEELVRPPVPATPSSAWIGGIQEENIGLSTLDIHVEIHN